MKTKKISIVLPNLGGGGAEKMRLVLANYWSKLGFEIEFVVLNSSGGFFDRTNENYSVVNLNCIRLISSVFPLVKYIKKTDADVILVAMWPLTIIVAISRLLAMSKVKLVASEHCILSKYIKNKRIEKFITRASMYFGYRIADELIAVSNGVANDMMKLAFIAEDRVNVIYNPAYIPHNEDQELEELRDSDEKIIITAGSFKEEKNHQLLIKSFNLLRERYKLKCKLVILGEGHLRKEYDRLIHRLGLVDYVIFPGFIEDPLRFFSNADVFVLSSDHEGLGNVIIEALSCGLPIVSTDCESGPREILDNGKYGKLVPINSESELADSIYLSLMENQDSNRLIGRAKEFSVEKISKKYLSLMFK